MYFHATVGLILGLVSVARLVEALSVQHRVGRIAATLECFGGIAIVVSVVGQNLLSHSRSGSNVDAAHLVIGAAFVASGAATFVSRSLSLAWLALLSPFATLIVGALFVLHGADSQRELLLHSSIALALVIGSLAELAVYSLTRDSARCPFSLRYFSASPPFSWWQTMFTA